MSSIKTEWNLASLEGNFDKKRVEIKKKILAFADKWKKDSSYLENPLALKTALDDYEDLAANYFGGGDEGYYSWLKVSLDESNPELKAKLNQIESFEKDLRNEIRFFNLSIAKIDKEKQEVFLKDPLLKDYKHFLETLFNNGKYFLSEKEEKIMSLKAAVSYSNWVEMLSGFLSKEEVLWNEETGEKKSYAEIRSLCENEDKGIRDRAAKFLNEILEKYEEVAENELNSVLENKRVNDELRGYNRPDKSRHIEDDVSSEVVDALIKVVSSRSDISRRFYELKAKLCKVKNFTYSERGFSYGKINQNVGHEEAIEIVKKVFSKLDKDFLVSFERFLSDGRIDFFPKKGKSSGGFCTHSLKRHPVYILINYTNKLRDVTTCAHEMGHAINFEMMNANNNALNIGTPKSTAEVASTFMEDFVFEELLKDANDEEKLALRMDRIQDETQTIFRQIAGYRFEQELHKAFREKRYLSKEEIATIFSKEMKNYLGPTFEEGEDLNRGWIYWSHVRMYFYVYSYASGLIISKALQRKVRENPKFIEKIKEFLSAGTSSSPEDIFSKMGIKLDENFWHEGLNEIEKDLKDVEALAKKLGKI